MHLSELQNWLPDRPAVAFQRPDGSAVPPHYHLTEVGLVQKHFVDCGGIARREERIQLQLWVANDVDHRLSGARFLDILNLTVSQFELGENDPTVEVEYQGSETIGRYGLAAGPNGLRLTTLRTDCLAKEACSPAFVDLSDLAAPAACSLDSGCC